MSEFSGLPLFPLGLVLYPGEAIPLHIFEPRYREMVARCLEEDRPFGIALAEDDGLNRIGCTARIVRVTKRHDDGRIDIQVQGEQRFRIAAIDDGLSYLTVDGTYVPDDGTPNETDSDLRERAITLHIKLLELGGRTLRPSLYETEQVSYALAHNAGLENAQKQTVLEIASETDRLLFLVAHFERFIPEIEAKEQLRRKVQSNGHFRDFPPELLGGTGDIYPG
jgi:ATP-dependent Lon protease